MQVIQFVVTNVCPQLQDPLRQQVTCLRIDTIAVPRSTVNAGACYTAVGKIDICCVPPQCLSYTPILIPTAVLWLSTNFPPNVVCADLAMCEAAKALQALLLQVSCLQFRADDAPDFQHG